VRWSSWRVDSVLAGVAPGLAWQPAGGIVAVTLLLSWNCFISNCIYYNFSLARLAGMGVGRLWRTAGARNLIGMIGLGR
jgi:hypothetical protein